MRQAEQDMQTSLRGIAQRAEACPGHRFGNLYGLLSERNLQKKLRQAVQAVTRWLRKNSAHAILATLARKLRGHYNYYGVCGNARGIWRYYREVVRLLFKWLNRRSQRRSYNWKGFLAMCEHFRLPRPNIVAYWD